MTQRSSTPVYPEIFRNIPLYADGRIISVYPMKYQQDIVVTEIHQDVNGVLQDIIVTLRKPNGEVLVWKDLEQ